MKYEIEKLYNGYAIKQSYHRENQGGGIVRYTPTHYVRSYRTGVYMFTTDLLYAKRYRSEKTAQKHIDRLNRQ